MDTWNEFALICEYYSVWNEVRSLNTKLISLETRTIDNNIGNSLNYGDGI